MGILDTTKELCHKKIAKEPSKSGIYCNVTWDKLMCWDYTLAGTIARQPCPDYVNGLSSAGYATRECNAVGSWMPNPDYNKTDGWTNYSGCMGTRTPQHHVDYSLHLARIQLMSEIGYGVSLASLIVAVLIMVASKRLHCKSNVLHINLFLAFILRASVTFIKTLLFVDDLGLEKDITRNAGGTIEFLQQGTHWECKLVVSVLVYSVAASMTWIFMEGLYLHMLVYKTLFVDRNGTRIYIVTGWLLPLTFIIPWIVVRIFLDDELCWNTNPREGYVWIIKAPIQVSVLINVVFFINIVRVLCVRVNINRHIKNDSQHLRKTAKFVLVLIPLFGVIYIVSTAYPQGMSEHDDIVYLYCEMFYNSFQGFLLALLFCFLNEEVHNEIRRCWYRKRFTDLTTRTVLLSSFRKASRTSRDSFYKTTRAMDEAPKGPNKNCTCGSKTGEQLRWQTSKRDLPNGGHHRMCSWRSVDYEGAVVETNMSPLNPEDV